MESAKRRSDNTAKPALPESNIDIGNVDNEDGNIAIGNNIVQANQRYYIVQNKAETNETAQIIIAVARLVLSIGYIIALLATLLMVMHILSAILKL